MTLAESRAWAVLAEVPDPEIPVLSVVDLGIVRDVREFQEGTAVSVVLTPTYSGCPAMQVIEEDIRAALVAHGVGPVSIEMAYAPAWTSDWLSDEAKRKLEEYGIAPPGPAGDSALVTISRRATSSPPKCPYCGSRDTEVKSEFGSTACKSICFCNACRQPFEQFKAI